MNYDQWKTSDPRDWEPLPDDIDGGPFGEEGDELSYVDVMIEGLDLEEEEAEDEWRWW